MLRTLDMLGTALAAIICLTFFTGESPLTTLGLTQKCASCNTSEQTASPSRRINNTPAQVELSPSRESRWSKIVELPPPPPLSERTSEDDRGVATKLAFELLELMDRGR